jgi:hypothetical protein
MTTASQYAANVVRKTAPTTKAVVGNNPFTSNLQLGAISTVDGTAGIATDASNQRVMGVFDQVNYTGTAAGQTVELKGGIYGFNNSLTHPVLAQNVGTTCFVEGTSGYFVAATGTCVSNVAGRVIDLDATNGIVYVDLGRPNTTL